MRTVDREKGKEEEGKEGKMKCCGRNAQRETNRRERRIRSVSRRSRGAHFREEKKRKRGGEHETATDKT